MSGAGLSGDGWSTSPSISHDGNRLAFGHPLTPGQTFYAQVWHRDPGAVLDTNTTDALHFAICP